jgi:hypothetical protein
VQLLQQAQDLARVLELFLPQEQVRVQVQILQWSPERGQELLSWLLSQPVLEQRALCPQASTFRQLLGLLLQEL